MSALSSWKQSCTDAGAPPRTTAIGNAKDAATDVYDANMIKTSQWSMWNFLPKVVLLNWQDPMLGLTLALGLLEHAIKYPPCFGPMWFANIFLTLILLLSQDAKKRESDANANGATVRGVQH